MVGLERLREFVRDRRDLLRRLRAVERGGADYIHVDVMDGHFVPNITIGVPVVRSLKRVASVPLDVHLMISDPDRYVDAFAEAGASMLSVHVEVLPHLHRTVHAIKANGVRAGVVLNPSTPVVALEEIAGDVDFVLVMSVNPGFGGQSFIPSALEKLRRVRQMIDRSGKPIRLEIDGGVKADNIAEIAAAGADTFVAGSAIFNAPDYADVIGRMKAAVAAVR